MTILSSDHARIILGSWSESVRIVFLLAEAIHGVSAEILNLQILWQAQYLVKLWCEVCCIGNDVSYVTRINHEIHFAWQAQYLVTFWEIAGARNVGFFNTKSCPRSDEYYSARWLL